MPAEVRNSWKVLDAGVGVRRRLVARAIGRPESSFEKQLIPPPSEEFPNGNGVTNALDLICTIIAKAEHPHVITSFICREAGGQFVPTEATQQALFVQPADVETAAAELAKELRRREPSLVRLRCLRDALAVAAHRLVTEQEGKEATSGR